MFGNVVGTTPACRSWQIYQSCCRIRLQGVNYSCYVHKSKWMHQNITQRLSLFSWNQEGKFQAKLNNCKLTTCTFSSKSRNPFCCRWITPGWNACSVAKYCWNQQIFIWNCSRVLQISKDMKYVRLNLRNIRKRSHNTSDRIMHPWGCGVLNIWLSEKPRQLQSRAGTSW